MNAAAHHAHEDFRHRYGPWALVTGASRGIGRAVALELAERGLDLLLVARCRQEMHDLVRQIGASHPVACEALTADLGRPEGVAAVLARMEALDIGLAVHAAGFGTSGPFVGTAVEAEADLLAVNAIAPLRLSHALAPRLLARGRGGLVFMSSIVAFQGVARAANYAASKAYVQSLAEALALELRPHGVDVLASAPGPVHSGFAARAGMTLGHAAEPAEVAAATIKALGRYSTLRPGMLAKLLGGSLATAPRALRVRIMAAIMAGMTRNTQGGADGAGGVP